MSNVRYAARPVEVNETESETAPVKARAKALWVDYETDPEIIASVLPRPLSPGSEPIVHLNIGDVHMDGGARFGIGNITVRAAHGDVQGEYGLAMPMGSEAAVVGGRETWGEPKKLAECRVERSGDDVVATIHRAPLSSRLSTGEVVSLPWQRAVSSRAGRVSARPKVRLRRLSRRETPHPWTSPPLL